MRHFPWLAEVSLKVSSGALYNRAIAPSISPKENHEVDEKGVSLWLAKLGNVTLWKSEWLFGRFSSGVQFDFPLNCKNTCGWIDVDIFAWFLEKNVLTFNSD